MSMVILADKLRGNAVNCDKAGSNGDAREMRAKADALDSAAMDLIAAHFSQAALIAFNGLWASAWKMLKDDVDEIIHGGGA